MTEISAVEIVGVIELLEMETSEGTLRFLLNDDGRFKDINGNWWLGSKLMSVSDVDMSINGTAPAFEAKFSFIQDPDEDDLIEQIETMGGVDVIKGYTAKFYEQLISRQDEFFNPVLAPELITQRKMINLTTVFDGPQIRTLAVTMEGPFALRSKPTVGTYNTEDHARLVDVSSNPSLEFMPKNSIDEQPFFGL